MASVTINQIHKHYDDFHAVKGVSLERRSLKGRS
jgi:ABC-type histidine transport system ATPase subunit